MPVLEPTTRRRGRQLLRWAFWLPLGSWALYLMGANLFLHGTTGAGWINRKPEKLLVEWQCAWSIVPGRVEVRDLRIRGQNRVAQWQATVERATVPIALPLLAGKIFRTRGASGSGVNFRLRRRLDRMESASERELETLRASGPRIPGLDNPPSRPPEVIYERPERRITWTVDLDGLQMSDVREVWLDGARLTGSGDLAAEFRLSLRRQLELQQGHLVFQGAELRVGGAPAARDVDLDLKLSLAPLDPRQDRGRRALAFLGGSGSVNAEIDGLTAIDSLFGGAQWLSTSASGRLEAVARVERGVLQPTSRLSVETDRLMVGFAGNRAVGHGSVHAEIVGEPARLETRIELEGVELERAGARTPHARDGRFRLTGSSGRLHLADRPFTDLEAALELESARVDDLSVYDDYLLSADSVRLSGGPAWLSGNLQISASERTATGEVSLTADRLIAVSGDVRLAGRLSLRTRLREADLTNRRYDLSGSLLELSDVQVSAHGQSHDDWWARLRLEDAELHQAARPTLSSRVTATLRDSGPVVALIAERKRYLRLVDGLLTVKNVSAQGRLDSQPRHLSLREIEVDGGKLEVLGELELNAGDRDGLIFVRFGPLSGAVELEGGDRDWKLTRSRRWFEERRAARAAARR